ncbi:universal stress protein [Chloroflexota bacterium]
MFNRILVALDGSELSESALPYVEELAGALNSEVVLINVCEPGDIEHRHMYQLYVQKIAEQVRNHIKAYPARKANMTTSVKTVVLDGDPANEIIDYVEKNDISLIIMASHGRSGIMLWTMGSIATRVTERINKPVLFIRASSTTKPEVGKGEIFNKILVPLDGSEVGEAVLPYIKELASKLKPEISLFQVVEPGQHVHTVGGLSYVAFPEQEMEALQAKAKRYLKKIGRRLTDTKANIRYEIKAGNPTQEIIKFADKTDINLIAISTHELSGSIAHKVLQAGHSPIMLVRTPEVTG